MRTIFGNGGGADVDTEIAVYDNARLLLWAEISLKDRKILLILPEIGSLGGVFQQISLYNELVRKHACVSNSAG